MIRLLNYINKNNIVELETTKTDIYARQLIENCLGDKDANVQQEALSQFKTKYKELNLTKGFSLIHLRIDSIQKIRLSVGIFPEPKKITKNEYVNAVFCIVIPDTKCRTYLSLMAHLTRLLSKNNAGDLFHSNNKEGIVRFIRDFEES